MRLIKIQKTEQKWVLFSVILCIIAFTLAGPHFSTFQQNNTNPQNPNSSGIWATLDLTNPGQVNNTPTTRFSHNGLISIQGRLYNRITDEGKSGYTVALVIDSILHSSINVITDFNGSFQIDYTIDDSLNVYSSHMIEAQVTDSTPDNVEYRHHYIIYINTTSFIDIDPNNFEPKLAGELFEPNGFLRFVNGTGIPFTSLNYYWYINSGTLLVDSGIANSDGSGSIQNLAIPDLGTDDLTIEFTYASPPEVGFNIYSTGLTRIFTNVSCIWNLPMNIVEGSDLVIDGQLISLTNPSISISDRDIIIFYNGTNLGTIRTDASGRFSLPYTLAMGTGMSNIRIELQHGLPKEISTTYYFTVQSPTAPGTPGTEIPPFTTFLSIFIPILIVIIGGLAGYGFYYYKKQDKVSKVVELPLESKIRNLKILKDSGRLEESLSYLFNAIYMELINAKYGITRKDNETIRDFAIISVKNLRLNPTSIYPFIQSVEAIIYAKPFQITDKDFYNTIELFSPIYFQLTGYNFVLNF